VPELQSRVIDRLNKEINAGLADPNLKARLADLGGTVLTSSPADFGKLVPEETEKWAKVIKFSGAGRTDPGQVPARYSAIAVPRVDDPLLQRIVFSRPATGLGLVSRVTPVQTAMRNCTRDEGRSSTTPS
jgi:hypothetical protein